MFVVIHPAIPGLTGGFEIGQRAGRVGWRKRDAISIS